MQCGHGFDTKSKLSKHEPRCRLASSNYIKVKTAGSYPCQICPTSFESPWAFKQHIFDNHTDVEVQVAYNRDVEAVIGAKMLQRIRTPLLNAISSG